jgi:branched-subunit amino acid ABC-type transport system permease component
VAAACPAWHLFFRENPMLYLLEDTINGILMGSIYGLTAMGLTVIFGVLKVINFAHGSLLMVSMYAAYWAKIGRAHV